MENIEVHSHFDQVDPYGNPVVLLKVDGRMALFAVQVASTFQGESTASELLKRLRDSSGYVEGEGWKNLTYGELKGIQTWEKTMSGKSAIESLFPSINPNGAAIIFEEAALWLLARSNTTRGKEFAKRLVETFVSVRNGRHIAIEDFKRLEARKKLTETEKKFAAVIYERGVTDSRDIAEIKSVGDKHLFGGNSTSDMKKKYGITKKTTPLADYLPTVSIKAKDLVMEMTAVNAEQKNLNGKSPIRYEHIGNSRAVRSTLESRGIKPENLPPAEDIKMIEKRIKQDNARELLPAEKSLKIDSPFSQALPHLAQVPLPPNIKSKN